MDNRFNEVFPSFDPYNSEFSLGSRIIDIFPSCFLSILLASVAKAISYLACNNSTT